MPAREDEAAMLKLYGLSSLDPHKWEQVQNEDATVLDALGGAAYGLDGTGRKRLELEDPLGLRDRLEIPADMDFQSIAPTLLSSKQFSPSAFLSLHHPDATFTSLQRGISNLRENVDKRGEEVRILVEREFGRFVGVKGSGDAVYKDMRTEFLAEGTDHGTREIREILKVASHKADTLYLPLLSNSLKAQKLKSTLNVFERSKFLFSLPRSLRTEIQAGRYDIALRDYNKGLYLYSERPSQLLPITTKATPPPGAGEDGSESAVLAKRKEQQRRVVNKVWAEVEKIMGEMKSELEGMLKTDGGKEERGIEGVEKCLEILLQLNPKEEPAWLYFDAQHKHITARLRSVFETQQKKVLAARQASANGRLDETDAALNLQRCVERMRKGGAESVISKSAGSVEWEATFTLVKHLSDTIMQTLPTFWKVCRGYIDGKYRKRDDVSSTPGSKRTPAHCRTFALDIVKLYISLLAQFFTLSDVAVATASTAEAVTPTFLPIDSNSLTTCHFTSKILKEIVECASEIEGFAIASNEERSSSGSVSSTSEAKNVLKNFVESARWRFEEVICETWSKDAKIFFHLETWQLNARDKTITNYLSLIEAYQNHNTTSAWQIAGGSRDSGSSKAAAVPMTFISKVKNAFLDSLYFLLDGLVHLAFSDYEPLPTIDRNRESSRVDPKDAETRILLTLSNLAHLKEDILPRMIDRFDKLYGVATTGDRKTLDEVVAQLDKILMDDLAKRKTEALRMIIQDGLINGGTEWAEGGKPTDVRPYMFKALLYLVKVHSDVSEVTPNLVKRVVERMMEELSQSIKDAFGLITKMSMGGMLTATLEIEFLHQTLGQYVTADTKDILNDIYTSISQTFTRRNDSGDLQRELEDLKKILFEARRATSGHYLCFKPIKTAKAKKDEGKAA